MANGTIAVSQLEILTQSGTGIITIVPPATNTNRTLTLPDATSTLATSADLTTLNASNLSSGTVATARLGTGTANATTYLRGDSTWAAVGGGVTSLNGETGAITNTTLYAIGSYVTGRSQNYTAYAPNSTLAGTSLYQAPPGAAYNGGVWYTNGGTPTVSLVNTGTWRCMSQAVGDGTNISTAGLWVRIS